MNYLFPQQEQQNKKTLVIIGNGFDLASGIKSSYNNFKQWLQMNDKYRHLISLMDIFFSNQRDVWGDIEKALGEYDEDSIVEYCKPDEEIDYDHPRWLLWKIALNGYLDQCWMNLLRLSKIGWTALTLQRREKSVNYL